MDLAFFTYKPPKDQYHKFEKVINQNPQCRKNRVYH